MGKTAMWIASYFLVCPRTWTTHPIVAVNGPFSRNIYIYTSMSRVHKSCPYVSTNIRSLPDHQIIFRDMGVGPHTHSHAPSPPPLSLSQNVCPNSHTPMILHHSIVFFKGHLTLHLSVHLITIKRDFFRF